MPIPLLLALSIALHLYIGGRIVPALPLLPGILLALLLVASSMAVPAGLLARRLARPPVSDRLATSGLFFLGLFSSLFVATVLRDAGLLLLALLNLAAPGLTDLEAVRHLSAPAVPVLALAATLLGYLNARRTPRVRTVTIEQAGLPSALEGFTIVQITDLHVGPTIRRRFISRVVDAVNRLQPDVVAITGDLVDGPVHELGPEVAPLRGLTPRVGSFFVTGNHEYYSGVYPWLDELRRIGVRVLLNEHLVIERGGARLVLAGVTDYSAGHFDPTHRSDPGKALVGAPADAAMRVLLAHQPRSAPAAAEAGFDLQISGHTHGGQFLPWNFFVRFQQPFTAGLHRVDQLRVYVSRGTGYWGPPKRFGAPSEITRIRLARAAPTEEQASSDELASP